MQRLRHLSGIPRLGEEAELRPLISRAQELGSAPTEDFRPGREIPAIPDRIGNLTIVSELGSGGFGIVYLARDPLLHRQVAVKVLQIAAENQRVVKERFLREMRAVGQLRHDDHVVQALQAFEESGRLILVMEYVAGLDLKKLVRKLGRLHCPDACEVIRQAATGLQFIHDSGFIHRDVKPANLLLSTAGVVKVADLGLVLLGEEQVDSERPTESGQIVGTLDYLAPEQAKDPRHVDGRADIYSLGCSLYFLLAGQVPFPAQNKVAKLAAHRLDEPSPVESLAPELPRGLPAVVRRMMAKAPSERFSTPQAVVEAITPWCRGADLTCLLKAQKDAAPSHAARSQKRTKNGRGHAWPYLAAGPVLILIIAIVWYLAHTLAQNTNALRETPGPLYKLPEQEGPAAALAISPAGDRAVAFDGTMLRSWDMRSQRCIASWPHGGDGSLAPANLVFMPDSAGVMVGLNLSPGRSSIECLNLTGQTCSGRTAGHAAVLAIDIARDAGTVITAEADGKLYVRNAGLDEILADADLGADARSLRSSADGQRVLCGCDDGTVQWYDFTDRTSHAVSRHKSTGRAFIVAVGLSRDGHTAASICLADQLLCLWDLPSGTLRRSLPLDEPGNGLTCGSVSGDMRFAWTGHRDGSVALWQLSDLTLIARYRQHNGPVASVALAAEHQLALSSGKADNALWVYRLAMAQW